MAYTIGQFFPSQEKIGALTHSAGTLTLAASHVKVGGVGVSVDNLSKTLSGLSANTLYFVYLVISAGIPQLVESINDDDVGPAGFTAWKQLGAFLTDALGNYSVGIDTRKEPLQYAVKSDTTTYTSSTSTTAFSNVPPGTYLVIAAMNRVAIPPDKHARIALKVNGNYISNLGDSLQNGQIGYTTTGSLSGENNVFPQGVSDSGIVVLSQPFNSIDVEFDIAPGAEIIGYRVHLLKLSNLTNINVGTAWD